MGILGFFFALNGVGVDGVGGNFSFFFVFLRFSLFFFVSLCFSPHSPRTRGKQLQFTGKTGNFTPTPSAPTPLRTSRLADESAQT